ncbi:NAD(P)H-binding protein [Lactobacillus sp. UCMA15818]|uniref:NAD(P)H-binding protein n=1 Tax=Lactobacillus sp. UCMA15818 TaxID=2583394 RepID=UPI0025B0F890|nr:NAD(P)H-binding protein [Lactobacillus sp. UCMA15818]MDN2453700.1 NAD-dependent epimerase/dehydratase family protein [Lactobacillus sp. UCMA15818]
MKIFIVGATGRVATKLIEQLTLEGHEILAGARSPERVLRNPHVTPLKLDLHTGLETLSELVKDADAIYFVAGSRGKDLLQTDAFGAVKIMQVAEKNHINRFIMLSSAFSLEPEQWKKRGMEDLLDYNIAKFFADNYLVHQSKLDYTILQAAALIEEKGSHRIALNENSGTKNTIQNVAETLAAIIKFDNTSKKIIKMSDGKTPIDEALTQI